jgi:type II secretion system protein J
MDRDFEAVQARPVRDASDRIAAPLVGAEVSSAGDASAVTLTRGGVLDASDFASPPLRVAYRLRDGSLERLTWPGLDQAVQSVPSVSVVLRGVAGLGIRYRDASGIWQANWPPAIDRQDPRGSASSHVVREGALDVTLPTAVDMTIQLAGGDEIRRLIVMRSAARS